MSKIDFKDGKMQFINCSIPFPTKNGLHIVSSGCGSGKTTMIQEIIKEKWSDGILVVTATMNAADEINERLKIWRDGTHIFGRCNLKVLHSGENRITEMENYKSNPLSLADADVLIITSARLIIDPYELFLSYKSGTRGLILIDEMINFYPQPFNIPEEMKSILSFVDQHKTHNGKAGIEFKDSSGKIWQQHCYQDMETMNAAYLKSGYKLFKTRNELSRYKTEYIFKHILKNGLSPILGRLKDFADQTCVILFDGTADCLFKESDPRLIPITGKRYKSDIQFLQFDMPFKRKNKEEWKKETFMSVGSSVLDMLKGLCYSEKTLIVTWKSLDVFKEIKNGGNADLYEEATGDKVQYNFPKLLGECLIEFGVNPNSFAVIYRGSGQDRGSNEYKDFQNIVFLGEWHILDNIVADINKMFDCKCGFKDYMKSLVIQTICRIQIREHAGLPIKVYFSSDIDYNLMADVQKYFIENSPDARRIKGIKKPCKIYSKPEKKQMIDLVLLYSHDPHIRNSIENEASCSFNITLDELYNIIPKSRKAKDKYNNLVKFLNNRKIYMNIT
jgi:hypothetical protein